MRVSVVVVNWNSGSYLRECVESVISHGGQRVNEVVVVDNGSSDGSQKNLPRSALILIESGKNLGFARACNVGALRTTGETLLFLNPDARLSTGTVAAVLDFFDRPENASVGICGVRLLDERGDDAIAAARFPSLRVMVGKTTGLSKILPRMFPPHMMTTAELAVSREVDQVIGACFFVRRSLFELLGGFDEDFFVYFEEVDFAYRARKQGYTSYFLRDATAFHAGGVSSGKAPAHRLYYSLRSRLTFASKHYSSLQRAALWGITFAEFPIRLAYAAVRLAWRDVLHVTRAYLLLLRSLLSGRL